MINKKPTFKQKTLKHIEEYRCWECDFEWFGKAGPQHACEDCGSLYCEWLTYKPERFTDEKGKAI